MIARVRQDSLSLRWAPKPSPAPVEIHRAEEPLDPKLLELLPPTPPAWQPFIKAVRPEEISIAVWKDGTPWARELARFGSNSVVLTRTGEIYRRRTGAMHQRTLIMTREQTSALRLSAPLALAFDGAAITLFRFLRSDDPAALGSSAERLLNSEEV